MAGLVLYHLSLVRREEQARHRLEDGAAEHHAIEHKRQRRHRDHCAHGVIAKLLGQGKLGAKEAEAENRPRH